MDMKPGHRGLLVVGASLAGLRAVETARKSGYGGPITLLGAEEQLPYDRPPLSKAYLDADGPDDVPPTLPSSNLLEDLKVDVLRGVRAEALDLEQRTVLASDGAHPYDALVIATGATPRTMAMGAGLEGVHGLRTWQDARSIRSALDSGARTVVIGGGFIGSEVASAARKRGLDVTILEGAPAPLVRALGPEMAHACSQLHSLNGAVLRCRSSVAELLGSDRVTGVRLLDDTVLSCDLVVVGIGAVPETSWLDDSGLVLDDGVVCDEYLRASAPGVYAAGDVARWRNPLFDGTMRSENWTSAAEQGAQAARNAVGPAQQAYETVPYFWSDWYDTRIQFVGISADADVELVSGSVDEGRYVALYRRGSRLCGVLAVNRQSEIMKYRALIAKRTSWDEALRFAQLRAERISA